MITSKAGKGIYSYESFLVEKVDGADVHYSTKYPGDQEIFLAPGNHQLTIKVAVRRGLTEKPLAILTDVPIKATAGHRYVTNGSIEGYRAIVWIEEAGTGKVVTEKKRVLLMYLAPSPPPILSLPVG